MGSNSITPTFVMNFETNMRHLVSNAWARTLKRLWWPRIMNTYTSGGAFDYVQWFLESAKIQSTGPKGAQMIYDPMFAVDHGFGHSHFGNGLELFRSEIEDNQIDKATKWASDTGSAQMYWPQRMLTMLLKGGESTTFDLGNGAIEIKAYDGLPFFSDAHPVHIYEDTTALGATLANGRLYSNLHVGTPFSVENLARVVAYVESIQSPARVPMGAMPAIALFPTQKRLRANQYLNAEYYTDVLNGGQAAATNIVKQSFEFEAPIFAAELNGAPDDWYLAVPASEDAIDSAVIYIEREAFSISTYSPKDQASLADMQVFRWHNRGRNGGAFGHPYMLHKCKGAGVQPDYLSGITI